MKEFIILSKREAQRIQVLEQVVRKSLALKGGATHEGLLSWKRLLARYRREGIRGMVHRRRGRALFRPQRP